MQKLSTNLRSVLKSAIDFCLGIIFPEPAARRLWSKDTGRFLVEAKRVDFAEGLVSCRSIFSYSDSAVKDLIWSLKYHGDKRAARLCAEQLWETIVEEFAENLTFSLKERTVLVPVPLGIARLRERGFNQVELVVREIANIAGNDCPAIGLDILQRAKETRPQTSLSGAARKANMRGAFKVVAPEKVEGRRIILVDDVVTTGATLFEAKKVLERAGAARVHCFALAH